MKRNFILSFIVVMLSFASYAVSPITGVKTMCTGSTTTLADSTVGGVWTSTVTSVAVVGSTGVVYGMSAGTSLISYTVSGVSVFTTVTVMPTPGTIGGSFSVCAGSTITLTDASTGGMWSSSNTAVATAGPTSGVVTGVSAGTATITYMLTTGCYTTKTISVTGASAITGPSSLCVGSTITLSDATSGGTWSTGGTVVSVSSTGVVTGLATGVANVYYSVGGCGAYHTVTVVSAPSSIGGLSTVCVGSTITLSDATTGGAWTSGNTAVASAGITSGVITGISSGTANITYTLSGGCYTVKTVSVTSLTTSITGPSAVCVGSTITLSDATPGGTWQSGNTSIATTTSIGVVTGVSAGVVNIYYSVGGCGASYTVTVTAGSVITGPSTVCVGGTITLADTIPGGTWSVGATSIAMVGSTGTVTGASAGVTNIYYSVGGCFAYHTVTVITGPSSIGGTSSVCVGSSITLTDATSGGVWQSGNTAIATANPTSGGITGVAAGTVVITYKLTTGCFVTKTITVTTLTTPITGPSTVCIGATITLSDGTTGGTWLTGNSSIATTTSIGVVTGVSAGVVNIYYSVGGCGASHTVTVIGGSTITGPSTVCVGGTITLADTISGGTWSLGATSIATIGSTGVVTGVSPGVTYVYYIVGGCGAYHSVTVVTGPSSIGGPSSVCVGSSITLTDATSGGSWTSGNTAIATIGLTSGVITGVASGTANITYRLSSGCYAVKTISVTGGSSITGPSTVCVGATITLSDATPGGSWTCSGTSVSVSSSGVVTGLATGVVNIYYIAGGCAAYHTVTVTPGASSISGSSSVCVGSTTTYTDATTGGVWSSSNTGIATVGVSTGVITGISTGTATISYTTTGGCVVTKVITVITLTTPISGGSTTCVGSTLSLSDATPGGTWLSGNTSIATVSSTGVVTGVAAGVVNIYYSVSGCGAYHTVTIVTAPKSITGPSTVCVGSTISLSDSTGGGSWLSSNTSIATISSSGVVTGVTSGVVNIYYLVGTCGAYHTVTITTGAAPISGSSSVCVGSTITLSDASHSGSWSSSNSSIATVGITSGVVTGASTGVVTISYTVGGCSATYSITVSPAPKPISGPSGVCVGSTITLSDSVSGGTWLSSNTAVATISSGGVVTGVSAGTATIYYLTGSCGTYKIITVTGPSTISGPSVICAGATLTLSDPTTGGAWSSSSTSVATVGVTSGVVTGVSAGVATIYYSVSGCVATHSVTINPTPASISGPSTVNVSATISLSDASTGGAWLCSSTSVATVSSTGVVSGVATGIVNIYYIVGSCAAYHTVTVTPKAPGTIGGKITTGGAKGTSSESPVPGMDVVLKDGAGNTITIASTDAEGEYIFEGLANADYIVYPMESDYRTVASPVVAISATTPVVSGIDFHQNTNARTITPSTTAAVALMAADASISVFPNPASGNLNIKWDGQATGMAVMFITDVVGHEVLRGIVNMNEASGQVGVSLQGVKSGLYIVTIRSATLNYSEKLMVQQ